MKESNPKAAKGPGKNKTQLIVLGALGAVLVAVLFSQFGGDGSDGGGGEEVAAAAEHAAPDVAAAAMSSGGTFEPAIPDNPVLSGDGEDSDSVGLSAFTQFWKGVQEEVEPEPEAEPINVPSITLQGTMPGDSPLAIIDGQVKRLGASVQGWTLLEIHARSVVLKSPTGDRMTFDMALLDPTSGSAGGVR